jgi:hypothetical protein
MSERLDYYNDFQVRKDAERDQKQRLSDYAVNHLITTQQLIFTDKTVSLFIGAGTTARLFFEALVSHLGHGRGYTVVSNNLALLPTFVDNHQQGQDWSLRLYGEEVDLKNRSLKPQRGQQLETCLKRAKTSLAVISCASIWRANNTYYIGAFTTSHATILKQVVGLGFMSTYLIADDWKRLLDGEEPTAEQLVRREKDLHLFATIPNDSERLTLIIEAERQGQPNAYIGDKIRPALETWWKKPPQPTCFLSYSTEDEKQVDHLYRDLRKKGIKCWKWDHGTRPPEPLWEKIEEAISSHRPVILICSKNSLNSSEVNEELRLAFERKVDVITLRTDDSLSTWNPPTRFEQVKVKVKACRQINARNWENDHQVYEQVLKDLLECLQ